MRIRNVISRGRGSAQRAWRLARMRRAQRTRSLSHTNYPSAPDGRHGDRPGISKMPPLLRHSSSSDRHTEPPNGETRAVLASTHVRTRAHRTPCALTLSHPLSLRGGSRGLNASIAELLPLSASVLRSPGSPLFFLSHARARAHALSMTSAMRTRALLDGETSRSESAHSTVCTSACLKMSSHG
jgi:hypothetical protein